MCSHNKNNLYAFDGQYCSPEYIAVIRRKMVTRTVRSCISIENLIGSTSNKYSNTFTRINRTYKPSLCFPVFVFICGNKFTSLEKLEKTNPLGWMGIHKNT